MLRCCVVTSEFGVRGADVEVQQLSDLRVMQVYVVTWIWGRWTSGGVFGFLWEWFSLFSRSFDLWGALGVV